MSSAPFPIIPLKRSLQQKLNHFMDRFLTVHTRKLDGICFSSSYVSAVILPFVSQNIQMFFVIQHELIVQGKHVVRGSSCSWNIKSLIFLRVCPSGRSFHIANISSKISLFTTDPTHYEKTVLNQVSTFLYNIYRSELVWTDPRPLQHVVTVWFELVF